MIDINWKRLGVPVLLRCMESHRIVLPSPLPFKQLLLSRTLPASCCKYITHRREPCGYYSICCSSLRFPDYQEYTVGEHKQ